MRKMYDSTSPDDIPRDAEMVAYYVDGIYKWSQAWINLFPNAVKVPISAIGVNTAPVGDVEKGCIWPPENAVGWVRRARADGYDPTIYCNQQNDWQWVAAEFAHAGEPEPHWWVAKYDQLGNIPAGAVAKQYMHPPQIGKHYDLSAVADYWPGVDEPKEEENFMAGLTPEEQTELLTKTRAVWSALWDTDNAPIVGGGPGNKETVQDTVQRVAGWQDKQIEAQRIDRVAIANIETVVNRIDARDASGGMSDADRKAFAKELAAELPEGVDTQKVINAMKGLQGTMTYQSRPTGG